MASIIRRDGGWRARHRGPDGRQRERRFDRKVDAQRWVDEQTTAHVTGTYVDPGRGRITVGDWADRWLASKGNLKASTSDRYTGILAVHVRPAWGTVRLDAVTHDAVQAWTSDLTAAGLSAASVVKTHRVLSMVLAYAVRSRRLATNPADGVTLPRVTPAEKRYLRPAQVADLAEAAGPGRLVVLVLAYTGLRWGELAALRVSRVDLMRRRIHIAESVTEVDRGRLDWGLPKSHERRWVPVPRFLIDDLAEHVAGKAPDALAFTTRHGAVLRVGGARRAWFDQAAEAAGLAGLTPHELRHTAASLAVSAGANVKAVQRMLGHAKASMTLDVYADLFDDDLEAVADRLDEIARREGGMRAPMLVTDLDERRTGV
jgi:integrase